MRSSSCGADEFTTGLHILVLPPTGFWPASGIHERPLLPGSTESETTTAFFFEINIQFFGYSDE
jgi:hypothetical protein